MLFFFRNTRIQQRNKNLVLQPVGVCYCDRSLTPVVAQVFLFVTLPCYIILTRSSRRHNPVLRHTQKEDRGGTTGSTVTSIMIDDRTDTSAHENESIIIESCLPGRLRRTGTFGRVSIKS